MQLKILHAAETIRGGPATVIRSNVLAQRKRFGAQSVAVLVPAEQADDLDSVKPLRLHCFGRTGRNLASSLRFCRSFIRAVKQEKPDIVHLHSTFAGVLGRLCLLLVRRYGRPATVYCPHGWSFIMEGSLARKRIYALIERLLAPLADAIICVSEFERDEAMRFGLPAHKMAIIHNGVTVPEAVPSRAEVDPSAPLRLLFVGRLDTAKGFDILLRVMEELEGENFHLTVVGDAVLDDINAPQSPNITYVGWVPGKDVPGFFITADVLVMPSRWEAFGLAAVEAAMYGVPLLASRVCSLPAIVLDNETGRLAPSEDALTFARMLRETPRAAWLEMGQKARRHVLARFSAERMTAETINLYEQLIQQ